MVLLTFHILENPQQEAQPYVHLLVNRIGKENNGADDPMGILDEPSPFDISRSFSGNTFPTMAIELHQYHSSSPRITDQTVAEFVRDTFPEFHLHTDATCDERFRFRLTSASSLVGQGCRRGFGNHIYLGAGVKFGPMVQAMLDSSTHRTTTVHSCDFVEEGKILILYQGANAFDVPFIADSRGILVNENVAKYGFHITVPDSQRA